jgi:polysaccharide export outer membrane protein
MSLVNFIQMCLSVEFNAPLKLKIINQFSSEIQPMKILMIALSLALSLFFSACSSFPSASTTGVGEPSDMPATADGGAPTADSYMIQPGDVLEISVWKEKDLQKDLMVRPDGGLNFPLTGDIIASGKTVEQLRKELVAKLTKYVPDPVVTVSIKQSLGNKIYIVGNVNKPGDYIVIRNVDVMQALSMAGGPTPYASVNNIKILRRVSGEQKVFLFKYSHVEKGEDLEQNIMLQGGDVVVVP